MKSSKFTKTSPLLSDYPMGQAKSPGIEMGRPQTKYTDTDINARKYRLFDLNPQSLSDYRARFFSIKRIGHITDLADEPLFLSVGVARKENGECLATNAGLLCFGFTHQIKEVFPFFRLGYIQSDGQSVGPNYWIVSDAFFPAGNLFQFVKAVSEELSGHLSAPFYFQDGFDVGGQLLFETIREELIVALANADYSLPGGVKMALTPNEAAIRVTGLFADRQNALYGDLSVPRNNGVASIFRSIHYGDKISGMAENMRRFGFPNIAYE